MQIHLFPTYAHWDAGQSLWQAHFHGRFLKLEASERLSSAWVKILSNAMGIDDFEELAKNELFQTRARVFTARSGKSIPSLLEIGQHPRVELSPSGVNGHFTDVIPIPASSLDGDVAQSELPYSLSVMSQVIAGKIAFIGETGKSVISDIDDTIKESGVADLKELLKNTFTHQYEAVDGMAGLYDHFRSQGCAFHYVSASPWQLFEPLDDFRNSAGFPAGTYHLKLMRLKDTSIFNLLKSPKSVKLKTIKRIFRHFPRRKFYLVGDTGEQDPEIYAEMSKRAPEQVLRVLLRYSAGKAGSNIGEVKERVSKLFAKSKTPWQVFTHPNEVSL